MRLYISPSVLKLVICQEKPKIDLDYKIQAWILNCTKLSIKLSSIIRKLTKNAGIVSYIHIHTHIYMYIYNWFRWQNSRVNSKLYKSLNKVKQCYWKTYQKCRYFKLYTHTHTHIYIYIYIYNWFGRKIQEWILNCTNLSINLSSIIRKLTKMRVM